MRVSGIKNQLNAGDQEDVTTGTGATGPVAASVRQQEYIGKAVYRVSGGSANRGGERGDNFMGYIAQTPMLVGDCILLVLLFKKLLNEGLFAV